MGLTIGQALQQGVAAHKDGKLQEAASLYRTILQSQPEHSDASHNLGLIAVAIDQSAAALPLFKTAIEAEPKIEKFWLSYIDALIKLSRLDDAIKALEKSKEIGHKSENITRLGDRLAAGAKSQSVVVGVEEFYKNIKDTNLSLAALGWLFTDSFDRYFMENNLSKLEESQEKFLSKKNITPLKNEDIEKNLNSRQTINKLNNETDITKKFNALRKLISSNNANLINDSFMKGDDGDLVFVQKKTFDTKHLNIVIIGAGVCGLFLACSIKYCFGDLANVLIFDNRSKKINTREAFTRNWLTHIPISSFRDHIPLNARSLIECFGTSGQIGIPINVLESILMLSCKDQGVKFYFSPRIEYSLLDSCNIDLIFDATGGRLVECEYPALNSKNQNVEIKKSNIDLRYAGVNQLYNSPDSETGHLLVKLKPHKNLHYPYIGDNKIYTHMVKLTGIPENLMESVRNIVEPLNSLNLFFVWNGDLKKEINEGLILINLIDKEYVFLSSIIDKSMKLEYFLNENQDLIRHLNENIISMFEALLSLDGHSQIKIEKPFNYSPYINLSAGAGTLGGKSIFPVGDSLFCGNPKMGNGLSAHLQTINELVDNMVKI